jgi:hypothetical protein
VEDLFRYIEHQFVVPAEAPSISVENQSALQETIENHITSGEPEQIPLAAREFLARHFPSPSADPIGLGAALTEFESTLAATPDITVAALDEIVEDTFGRSAPQLATSAEFSADRETLENALLAVKLTTAFNAVDAERLAGHLRAVALIEQIAAKDAPPLPESVPALMARPIRIPDSLLEAVRTSATATPAVPAPPDSAEADRLREMRHERELLQTSYTALLAIPPE